MESTVDKLDSVKQRIAAAAVKSGRNADDVRMVAVTKYSAVGDGFLESLLDAGCLDFGEARPQLLAEKADFLAAKNIENVRWHLIGPLQRNKIRRVLCICNMIHSIDSVRLLEAIDRIVIEESLKNVPDLLLEINISGDSCKQGLMPNELPGFLEKIAGLSNVKISGLMGMSGLDSNDSERRREFQTLRKLRDTFSSQTPDNVSLHELSMGMSDDFESAIEEGATIVRIGSILHAQAG